MTLSSLLALLESGAIAQLRADIAAPLKAFQRGMSERGRSAPIELSGTGTPALVGETHVANLITAYVSDQLSGVELHYVASALDISPEAEYSSEIVRDVVFTLSSPENPEPLSLG